jgi:hypothetical protein
MIRMQVAISIAIFIVGIVFGWFCAVKLKKLDDMTTDRCTAYLKDQGYTVHLRMDNYGDK